MHYLIKDVKIFRKMELTTQSELKFLIRERWETLSYAQRHYANRNWFNSENPIMDMSKSTFYLLMGAKIGKGRDINLNQLIKIKTCMNEFLPEELKFKTVEDIISPNYLKAIQNEQSRLLQGEAN